MLDECSTRNFSLLEVQYIFSVHHKLQNKISTINKAARVVVCNSVVHRTVYTHCTHYVYAFVSVAHTPPKWCCAFCLWCHIWCVNACIQQRLTGYYSMPASIGTMLLVLSVCDGNVYGAHTDAQRGRDWSTQHTHGENYVWYGFENGGFQANAMYVFGCLKHVLNIVELKINHESVLVFSNGPHTYFSSSAQHPLITTSHAHTHTYVFTALFGVV